MSFGMCVAQSTSATSSKIGPRRSSSATSR
jgi:hypothetical protein